MTCELLREYCRSRDAGDFEAAARLEGQVLREHVGLAKTYACRGRWGDREDHAQAAAVGLLDAVRTYDPERGSSLASHAWPRMVTESAKESARQATVRVPKGRWKAGERALVVHDCSEGHAGELPKGELAMRMELFRAVERDAADAESETDRLSELSRAASCWRPSSLGDEPAETMARAAAALAAIGGDAWPRDHDRRISLLARLDAAVSQLEAEHQVDGVLWRRHNIGGELWGALAAEAGVTRQRVSARARRRQPRLAEILASLEHVEDEVLQTWASPTAAVRALRQVGLLSADDGPVETAYMAEDLEVALTEIGDREARAWSHRYLEQRSISRIARALGVSQAEAARMADRGTMELARLLRSESDPEQLELLLVEPDMKGDATTVIWFSPIHIERPRGSLGSECVEAGLVTGRGCRSRPMQSAVRAPDLRGIGPPAMQLKLM